MSSPSGRMGRPLVSVVIPTRDRYTTLRSVLEAICWSIDDPRLELIVQDNTRDNGGAIDFVGALGDARVRYFHEPRRLSIVDNTELALGHATGEFITFIGDDDFVSPFLIDLVELLSKSGAEAVTYPAAYYWWPSVNFASPSRFYQPGAFWWPVKVRGSTRWCDPEGEVRRVLSAGAVSIFGLPRLYHGVVRRDVLDELRGVTGRAVNGASPDMALALALGMHVKRHMFVDYPITIYGASRQSGGGYTAERRHFGRLEDQSHLPKSTIEGWNLRLPRVWSEYTIYPQTASEVLRAVGRDDEINYSAFYAAMFVNEPHLRQELWPLLSEYLQGQPHQILDFALTVVRKSAGRVRRAFRAKLARMPYRLQILGSPLECMEFLRREPPPLVRAQSGEFDGGSGLRE